MSDPSVSFADGNDGKTMKIRSNLNHALTAQELRAILHCLLGALSSGTAMDKLAWDRCHFKKAVQETSGSSLHPHEPLLCLSGWMQGCHLSLLMTFILRKKWCKFIQNYWAIAFWIYFNHYIKHENCVILYLQVVLIVDKSHDHRTICWLVWFVPDRAELMTPNKWLAPTATQTPNFT